MSEPQKAAGRVASVMQESRVFPPPPEFSARARIGSLADTGGSTTRPPATRRASGTFAASRCRG